MKSAWGYLHFNVSSHLINTISILHTDIDLHSTITWWMKSRPRNSQYHLYHSLTALLHGRQDQLSHLLLFFFSLAFSPTRLLSITPSQTIFTVDNSARNITSVTNKIMAPLHSGDPTSHDRKPAWTIYDPCNWGRKMFCNSAIIPCVIYTPCQCFCPKCIFHTINRVCHIEYPWGVSPVFHHNLFHSHAALRSSSASFGASHSVTMFPTTAGKNLAYLA